MTGPAGLVAHAVPDETRSETVGVHDRCEGGALVGAAAGARVAVMSRSKEKVDATVTRLQALGAQASGKAADVRLRHRRRLPADGGRSLGGAITR